MTTPTDLLSRAYAEQAYETAVINKDWETANSIGEILDTADEIEFLEAKVRKQERDRREEDEDAGDHPGGCVCRYCVFD